MTYFNLRDYGLPPSVWGGSADCEHSWGKEWTLNRGGMSVNGSAVAGRDLAGHNSGQVLRTGSFCRHCQAWNGCLGAEPTVTLFIAHLVEVMAEVHRVLRDDGTCWVNIGDSYVASAAGLTKSDPFRTSSLTGGLATSRVANNSSRTVPRTFGDGLKPKDLCLVPQRLAIALQDFGWYVRSIIIWAKPSCMPESVTDRPTTSHEYVLLLSKRARYYYDAEAVREPTTVHYADDVAYHKRQGGWVYHELNSDPKGGGFRGKGGIGSGPTPSAGRNLRTVWQGPSQYARLRRDLPNEVKQKVIKELIDRGIL